MAPVTRFAAFKYKPGTTDEQKRKALDGLIALYEENAHMVTHGPTGELPRLWRRLANAC